METKETDRDMFTELDRAALDFFFYSSPYTSSHSDIHPDQEQQVEELLVRPDGSTLTVQIEDDNKETAPLASSSTDHMKSQADVEDCGASHDQLLSSHSSDTDTEDSDEWTSPCPESDIDDSDWEETREGHSALNKLKSHKTPNVEGRRLSLSKKLSQNLKSSKQTPSMRSHTGSYLKRHMKTDRGVRSQTQVLSCSECPYAFTSQVLLHKHIKKSHNDLYRRMLSDGQITSATCQPTTSSVTSQKQVDTDKPESYSHQTLPQPGQVKPLQLTCTRKKTHTCKHCGKPFSCSVALEIHMRVHTGEKPFQCNTCNMSFSQSGALKRHMHVHTGEKPFQCNICNKTYKSFSDSDALKRHMRVHTEKKTFHCQPYQCNICDKSYSNSFNLKSHMRTHTGEKPFQCNTCYKSFNELGSLKKHMRTHTGEKPFHCNTCGNNFSDTGGLRSHMRLHAGDIKIQKPFHCNTCNKRFSRSYYLKLHMRTHTGETPFHCSLCGKGYGILCSLKKHMRTHTDTT